MNCFSTSWRKMLVACVISVFVSPSRADDLSGRVVDENGRPIAHAKLRIVAAAPRGLWCMASCPDCGKTGLSDAKGEFTFAQVADNFAFDLACEADGYNGKLAHRVARAEGNEEIRLARRQGKPGEAKLN